MVDGFAECVHIIPLGHEYDRAVRPFDTAFVNRVYLVVDTGEGTSSGKSKRDQAMDKEQKENYTPRVTQYFNERGVEVRIVETQTFDLEKLLITLTSLIRLEKEKGNLVYLNMSSSGRLVAVGAYLAAAAYNIPTYYVSSDYFAKDETERREHGVSVCTSNKSLFLPNFKFDRPNDAEEVILKKLYSVKEMNEYETGVSSMELVSCLEEKSVSGFIAKKNLDESTSDHTTSDQRNENSRRLMRLSIIMDKLVNKDNYVISTKEGRKVKYKINSLGEHAVCLCGMERGKYAEMFGENRG